METDDLHIYEEATNLFWGLVVVVCTTLATYILANSFLQEGWSISGLNQILALLLFAVSFTGILKLSEPLLHFVFRVERDELTIEIFKGEEQVDTRRLSVGSISKMKFEPYTSRGENEALFDFSPNYRLLWLPVNSDRYRPLIDLESASFTLKVHDIARIVRYLRSFNTGIDVPEEQEILLDL